MMRTITSKEVEAAAGLIAALPAEDQAREIDGLLQQAIFNTETIVRLSTLPTTAIRLHESERNHFSLLKSMLHYIAYDMQGIERLKGAESYQKSRREELLNSISPAEQRRQQEKKGAALWEEAMARIKQDQSTAI